MRTLLALRPGRIWAEMESRDGRLTAGQIGVGGLPPGVRLISGASLLGGLAPVQAAAPVPKAVPRMAPRVVPVPRPVPTVPTVAPKVATVAAGAGRLLAGRGAVSSPAADWVAGVGLMVRSGVPRAEAEARLGRSRPDLLRGFLVARATEARRAIAGRAEAEQCGWCRAAALVAESDPALIADRNQARRMGLDGGGH